VTLGTLAPLESQAERRRAQLLAVTAHLVVTSGVDAVTHAAVAEAAGCARTLVYRYFPSRTDLLYAVPNEYVANLGRRISSEDAAAGIMALAKSRPGRIPTAALELSERVWDFEWTRDALELRMAMLVLTADRDLAPEWERRRADSQDITETQLVDPLRQLGLEPTEIAVVRDTMLRGYFHATAAALAGDMSREEAVTFSYRVNRAAVQMFLK
jgi:AcrR family transcriptional regulator